MVKGIPTSWLVALPESLAQSVTAFDLIQQGRAQTCFLKLEQELEIFAKQSDQSLIRSEVNTLTFLAKQGEFNAFSYPELFGSEHNCLFTKKVNGTPLIDELDLAIPEQSLAIALVELHNIDATHFSTLGEPFELPEVEELNRALKLFDVQPNITEKLLSNLSVARTQIQKNKPYLGFIHGDLTPDNILLLDSKPAFLDWEFASVRDVRWDLATICEEFNLTRSQRELFVDNYLALQPEYKNDFLAGVKHWRSIYLVTCFIWSVEQDFKSAEYLAKLTNLLD